MEQQRWNGATSRVTKHGKYSGQYNRTPREFEEGEVHMIETQVFKTYAEKMRRLLEHLDKINANGATVGELHRRLGDDADRRMTLEALDYIGAFSHGVNPVRYTLRDNRCRQVPRSEWPTTPVFGRPSFDQKHVASSQFSSREK